MGLFSVEKAWEDIRDVNHGSGWSSTRTYFAGDARNYYQSSTNTELKRCTPEVGTCHVLRWHGLDGREYPTIDFACERAVGSA